MPKIIRAVKAAQVENQLKAVLAVARQIGARGLEIQQVPALMAAGPLKERVALVARFCRQFQIDRLAYHFPLPFDNPGYVGLRQFDFGAERSVSALGRRLTEETIDEAALTAVELGLQAPVLVVAHLFGLIRQVKAASLALYKTMRARGELVLGELAAYAVQAARRQGLPPGQIRIVRENNPPTHEGTLGLLDFHPQELVRTVGQGNGVNLDLAHFEMCRRYWQSGRGEAPGVDLVKAYADALIDWPQAIQLLAQALELLHLNDADSYQKEREGLEIGRGAVPHREIIPLICAQLGRDIMGTYEIRGGHQDPQTMARSDAQYRRWFGDKFDEYFI